MLYHRRTIRSLHKKRDNVNILAMQTNPDILILIEKGLKKSDSDLDVTLDGHNLGGFPEVLFSC